MHTAATIAAATLAVALLLNSKSPAAEPALPSDTVPAAGATVQPFGLLTDQWFNVPTTAGQGIALIQQPDATGKCRYNVVAVIDGKPVPRLLWLTPTDSPTPPPPPPPPTKEPLIVTIVEESAERTPARAAILFNDAIADLLEAKKWPCNVVDPNATFPKGTPPEIAQALALAKTATLPLMVIRGQKSGQVLWSGPMPEQQDAFIARLNQFGAP